MASDFGVVSRFIDRLVETGRVAGAGMAIAIEGEPVFQQLAGEPPPREPSGRSLRSPSSTPPPRSCP